MGGEESGAIGPTAAKEGTGPIRFYTNWPGSRLEIKYKCQYMSPIRTDQHR